MELLKITEDEEGEEISIQSGWMISPGPHEEPPLPELVQKQFEAMASNPFYSVPLI